MPISKPFFVRPLDFTILGVGNETAGHSSSNLSRWKEMGLTWKTSGPVNVYCYGDFGEAKPVDFLSVVSANAIPGTTTWKLTLANDPDEFATTPVYNGSILPFVDPVISRSDGLYHSHLELPAVYTARYWLVEIPTHTGDFEAAALVIGKKITPSHFYNLDYEMGVEDTGALEFGRFGVMDETPGQYLRTIDFTLGWQSRAEFETSFRPMMEELGMRGIVYFCMRPDADVYRQANTYMGVMKKPGFAKGIRKPETFAQEFSIVSFI